MDNTKRCRQVKCIYFLKGGCKSCIKCNSKSYEINTLCNKCLNCENEEGELRFGNELPLEEKEILITN